MRFGKMKNTVFLSLVVVGIFLLSGFGVLAQAPGIQINLSKHRAVENYVVESSHPYTNNYDNTWTITKSGASKIRIHFTSDTEVENTYDFLYFYDGSGTQIWKKTGTLGAFWTEWVNGDTVKVRLTTDYSVTKYGFKIDQREYETVTSSDVELSSGVAYFDSLSATGNMDYYKINVPSGSTKLEVILDGPASGCDFDLYVKYNQRPTTSSYDGRGYTSSSDETVTINSPSTGYYYIMPYSYSGSGSYSIKATVTGGSSDTTPPTISNIQSSSITSSGATITWTTDEASSSVVEYGTTTSY
ncbi:hypothetical protein FP804_01690, partial [archaeon]|nr:hypothetical protein [archaeon]